MKRNRPQQFNRVLATMLLLFNPFVGATTRASAAELMPSTLCSHPANCPNLHHHDNNGSPAHSSSTSVINASSLLANTGLTVDAGKTLYINFGNISLLDLKGNLLNSGQIFAYSNVSTQPITIAANNIYNSNSALISTALSSAMIQALGAVPALTLQLAARGDIVNHGTISSSSNLTTLASGSIQNL